MDLNDLLLTHPSPWIKNIIVKPHMLSGFIQGRSVETRITELVVYYYQNTTTTTTVLILFLSLSFDTRLDKRNTYDAPFRVITT